MRSFRSVSAVLAAILVLPGLVAGGAFATCLHVDRAPHQCGAIGVQCGDLGGGHCGEGAREPTANRSHSCSCSHVPNLPADPAVAVSTVRPTETAAPLVAVVPVRLLMLPVDGPAAAAPAHGPPPETAPVFLLDCSLLI